MGLVEVRLAFARRGNLRQSFLIPQCGHGPAAVECYELVAVNVGRETNTVVKRLRPWRSFRQIAWHSCLDGTQQCGHVEVELPNLAFEVFRFTQVNRLQIGSEL